MNNDKGVTLIELLATIVIVSMVFSVGIMLFSSISSFSKKSSEVQNKTFDAQLTTHTIKKELANAVEVFYRETPEGKELRLKPFKSSDEYKVIFYDSIQHVIAVYSLANIIDYPSMIITPISEPSSYVKVINIADEVGGFTVKANNAVLTDGSQIGNGPLIEINMNIVSNRQDVRGGTIFTQDSYTITQKLIAN